VDSEQRGIMLPASGVNPAKEALVSTNVVFIITDNQSPWTLGCYGNGEILTPNVDRLADQGVVFTQAISTFPLCSPYRGMMLSGKLPHRNGVVLNCNDQRPVSQLREDVTCRILL